MLKKQMTNKSKKKIPKVWVTHILLGRIITEPKRLRNKKSELKRKINLKIRLKN